MSRASGVTQTYGALRHFLRSGSPLIENNNRAQLNGVWCGTIGIWFKVTTGVRQGCILSLVLFALAIDWVMRTALTSLDVGLQWTDGSRLSDLDYADDIVLLKTSRDRNNATADRNR